MTCFSVSVSVSTSAPPTHTHCFSLCVTLTILLSISVYLAPFPRLSFCGDEQGKGSLELGLLPELVLLSLCLAQRPAACLVYSGGPHPPPEMGGHLF